MGDPALARARRLVAEEKLKLEEDKLRLEGERRAVEAQAKAYQTIDDAVSRARGAGRTSFWIQLVVALIFLAMMIGASSRYMSSQTWNSQAPAASQRP